MGPGDAIRPGERGPVPPCRAATLTSPEYTEAFNTVKRLGEIDSEQRTPDQTKAALFWSNDSGTYTTAGHWNNIATDLLTSQGTGVEDSARLLAELNVALADDFIATWDAKYTYVSWRPITAIRQAGEDGNPATSPDPSWKPLLNTPPFPNYVSGHASSGAAAATVLTDFFGAIPFSATSPSLPGKTRYFDNFSEAAAEDGASRVYGGVHFGFSITDGTTLGQNVANTALASFHNNG
jgi:PAP2 superfamily